MRVTMCASNEPYLNEVDLYYPISVCLNNDHHCGNLFEPIWALQLSSLVVLHNGNHLQAQKLFPIVGIISKEFMCIQNIFFSFVSCYVSNSVILYVKSCIPTSLDSMSSHLIAHVHMSESMSQVIRKPSPQHAFINGQPFWHFETMIVPTPTRPHYMLPIHDRVCLL
jgi:hypothetical protein